jgi:replicative DNA helicase
LKAFFDVDQQLVKECTIRPEQLYTLGAKEDIYCVRRLDEKGKHMDPLTLMAVLPSEAITTENIPVSHKPY